MAHLPKTLLFALFCFGQTAFAQILPCTPLGRNLIVNPDFEQGYFGFTTDFGRGVNNATQCDCATQGWILVAQISPHVSPGCQGYPAHLSAQYGAPNTSTSLNPGHPSNTSVATLATCNAPLPDHTTGRGFFLSVDPDACPRRAYWRQSLVVCPNTSYFFSVWVRNLGGLPAPTFHFEVDGAMVTPQTAYPANDWVQTALHWDSGNASGEVFLELINDLPGCDANDVAVDDLFLGVCAGVALTSSDLFEFCPGDASVSFQLSGHATGFAQPEYQWQFQSTFGGEWEDLSGENDTVLIVSAPGKAEIGLYRLLAAEQGNIESITCAAIGPAIRLRPFPSYDIVDTVNICRGQTFEGHSESGLYPNTFQTLLGCDSIRTLDLRVRGDVSWFVPNVFSPNDDGQNDQIRPFLSDENLDVFVWRIFDRWGNLVFESRDSAQAWDGYFRGKPCLSGVYAYTLQLNIRDCQQSSLAGDFTLIR